MIKILTYHEIDIQQWQELIETSATATWFQTKEAYEFYAANPEEMTPFAVGVVEDVECKAESVKCKGEENGKADAPASSPYTLHPTPTLKGVVVGYITRERSALKQFFTRRAIIIGGPLLAEDATAEEIAALLNAVKKLQRSNLQPVGRSTEKRSTGHSPIYIETRNFHDYSKWKEIFAECGFDYIPHLNFHVDCMQDNILSIMSESRRRQIKKAIRNGVEIVEAANEHDVIAFYNILEDLYKNKIKTPLFGLEFFLNFYKSCSGKFLLVKYQTTIIGGIICPILKEKAIYEWFVCGLDEMYKNQYPSVMATYAAIEYAKTNNLPLFDFMGAGKPDEPYGVRDFKARFGGKQVEYGRFLHVRKPVLYKIGKLGVKILQKK